MAMKMYKKSKLQYKDGYIVKDGKVLGIDNEIVDLFNKLEVDYQKAMWDKAHAVEPQPQHEEFSPETERGKVYVCVEPKTPNLDEAIEKSMAIMDDLDNIDRANRINDYMEGMQPVIQFTSDKRVVCFDQPNQHRFDLKYIGNPLALNKDDLLNIVALMFCN